MRQPMCPCGRISLLYLTVSHCLSQHPTEIHSTQLPLTASREIISLHHWVISLHHWIMCSLSHDMSRLPRFPCFIIAFSLLHLVLKEFIILKLVRPANQGHINCKTHTSKYMLKYIIYTLKYIFFFFGKPS